MTAIIETCPEFLATKNGYGRIPIHHAASFATTPNDYEYLLSCTKTGLEHVVGGEDSRGGLLLQDNYGANALHLIDDVNALRKLRHNDPPFLQVEDVQKYHLLHNAVLHARDLEVVKYLCELDPSCLYQLDDNNRLPIHYAIHHEREKHKLGLGGLGCCGHCEDFHDNIIYYLFERSVSHSVANESVGGLFTTIENGQLVLDYVVDNYGKENAWCAIKRSLSGLDGFPILYQTIKHSPQNCGEVIKRFPDSMHVQDSNNNRFPIHIALEKGIERSMGLS